MASNYISLPPVAGGTGAVDSVNGLTGVVVLTKNNIGLGNVNNTSDADKPISTATQGALDSLQTDVNAKQDEILGNNLRFIVKNGSGVVESSEVLQINGVGGIQESGTIAPDSANSITFNNEAYELSPTENSPNSSVTLHYVRTDIDPNSDGFSLGTSGTALTVQNVDVQHQGTSDVGAINLLQQSFNIGNGTDPIDVGGVGYAFGFGQFANNVNITGSLQGYGFQPNIAAGATMGPSSFVNAFYDFLNSDIAHNSYTSFAAGPNLASLNNNSGYTGLNISPNIDAFTGNSSVTGVNVSGNYGTFGTGGFTGVNVNPTVTGVQYATGLNVSMDNVTVFPGSVASVTIQDLLIETAQVGTAGNAATIEYTPGGVAGSEVVSNVGLAIEVQIESGVSTAQNIKDALDAFPFTLQNLTITVTGTASNPQTIQGPTSLTGGVDAGSKKAAYLDGDVQITGSLSFGGALSIGKLDAFASQAVIDGGGMPQSIHNLISQPTVAANATIANADTFGVNTAMLMTIGDNATVTTTFVGMSALALPAVVSMGTGSTVDQVAGATFAISLDATATGGAIANLDLCRALGIPNGVTSVTRLTGYKFELPFGDPGTATWGIYMTPAVNNYMAGALLVGGTPGSDDIPANSSVGIELKSTSKALLNARMTTAERDALTAINGMQLYNTTTNKLQVYAAGSWVDLH